jgi:hypothetical protein
LTTHVNDDQRTVATAAQHGDRTELGEADRPIQTDAKEARKPEHTEEDVKSLRSSKSPPRTAAIAHGEVAESLSGFLFSPEAAIRGGCASKPLSSSGAAISQERRD